MVVAFFFLFFVLLIYNENPAIFELSLDKNHLSEVILNQIVVCILLIYVNEFYI